MLKCPAIKWTEKFSIGQEEARFRRIAHSMGLRVVPVYMFHTLDNYFNREFTPLDWRLCTHGEPFEQFIPSNDPRV